VLQWIFLIGILLGSRALLFIGSLARRTVVQIAHRERIHAGSDYTPFVSIIVPAYNEQLVIENTIRSLLLPIIRAYEIIVVDDGSQTTQQVVPRNLGRRARALFTLQMRKGAALNTGLRYARGEIIIALDADTLFAPQTVGALAHRFYDKKLGAIAGMRRLAIA
jgi:cellulose synthase/poly-beta-1,6-N-acetylglucosamine synthase-like glycosyltransferase